MCWSSFSFSMSRSVVTLYVTLYYTAWLTQITSTIPVLCLSKLIEYSLKHQHACSDDSKQQLLKGLMEHFFPPGGACDQEDVSWFLEQLMLNSDVSFSFFSRQPAAIRSLKLYLTRILTVNSVVGSTDTFNPMDMFDDKVSV